MATKRKRQPRIGRPSEGLDVVLYVRITMEMHKQLVRIHKELARTGVPQSEAAVVRLLLANAIARMA